MSTTRRWGVALSTVAVSLWAAVVAAIITTSPDDGANIGAGMLFLLALPCTVTGAALIAGSRSGLPQATSTRGEPAPAATGASGNVAASSSLGLGLVALLLGFLPLIGSDLVVMAQISGTLLLALVALLLGAVALRRTRRSAGNTRVALAGTIVAASSLGLHGVLVPELIFYVTYAL